jgi:hypothetical protein
MANKHQESLDSLWEKYRTALKRLEWALSELDKKPKEVIVEVPVEKVVEREVIKEVENIKLVGIEKPIHNANAKEDYDPAPKTVRPKSSTSDEPVHQGWKPLQVPDFSIQADNNGNDTLNSGHAGFGSKFPELPNKGDMFLRVDQLPSILYKWNGKKWIEVDKTQSSSYAYNELYLQHLVEGVRSGQYDIDMLSDIEREQLARYIDAKGIS